MEMMINNGLYCVSQSEQCGSPDMDFGLVHTKLSHVQVT
jgi:hypothetical protein